MHRQAVLGVVSAGALLVAALAGTASASSSPPPLQAEANSAAAGDIPDNQVFVTFRDSSAGYSIQYPEGWAQAGAGRSVTIRDKNNIVRIVVAARREPSPAAARREVTAAAGVHLQSAPAGITIGGKTALKVTYTTRSVPNAVTGKRVTLLVDRYYFAHGGRTAVLDLGTPQGVDNVDAYRLMAESFRWR